MKLVVALKKPFTAKTYTDLYEEITYEENDAWYTKISTLQNTFLHELAWVTKVSVGNQELVFDLGAKPSEITKSDMSGYLRLACNNIPGGVNIGLKGICTYKNNERHKEKTNWIGWKVDLSKKGLGTEKDTLSFDIKGSVPKYYHVDYAVDNEMFKSILSTLGGTKLAYKSNNEESILHSVVASVTAPIYTTDDDYKEALQTLNTVYDDGDFIHVGLEEGSKPEASLSIKLNSAGPIKKGLGSLWSMLPESIQQGYFKDIALSTMELKLANPFYCKSGLQKPSNDAKDYSKHERTCSIFEHLTADFMFTWKGINALKGTEFTIGTKFAINPDGENSGVNLDDHFKFVCKFTTDLSFI